MTTDLTANMPLEKNQELGILFTQQTTFVDSFLYNDYATQNKTGD